MARIRLYGVHGGSDLKREEKQDHLRFLVRDVFEWD